MAATYAVDIDALAPLASGANDDPAPAVQAGDQLSNDDIHNATDQHRKRKFLLKRGEAISDEVHASKVRKFQVTSANLTAVGPGWAQQLQQQMHQMQQELQQQMQQMQQELQQQMQMQFPLMLKIDRLQVQNATTVANNNPSASLVALPRITDGNYPRDQQPTWFPHTVGDLDSTSNQNANALLNFYGLETTGNVVAKRARLRRHLCGP